MPPLVLTNYFVLIHRRIHKAAICEKRKQQAERFICFIYKMSTNIFINKKYGVRPMQLFIFDHVTLIQFKICCCVQNFIEIG